MLLTVPFDEESKQYFWSDIHYSKFNHYVALSKGQQTSFKGWGIIRRDDKFLTVNLQCLRLDRIFFEVAWRLSNL